MKLKTKPILFSLITSFCFFEPVAKLIYFKVTTHFEWSIIISNIFSRNSLLDILNFWLLFPIAGLTLLKIRVWSYCLFMMVMSYNIYSLVTYESFTWPYNNNMPHAYNLLLTLVCVGIIIAFCFPNIRKPFFDRRARWWEPQKRHDIFLETELRTSTLDTIHSVISNISSSGAFILNVKELSPGDRMIVNFRILNEVFVSEIEVVHKLNNGTINGYGVKFVNMSSRSRDRLSKVLKEWEHLNAPHSDISKQLAS